MHLHLYALQRSLPYAFDAHTTLPYHVSPKAYIRDFGSMLRVPYILGAKFLDW